ncbi:MAG: histidinol-phosphate transaminase [Deltaproteobacteria bacterium]
MVRIRKDIDTIQSYVPGKPIEEVRRELGLRDIVKLASNENALGPSPKALAAVRGALGSLHRYPEGGCPVLKKKLAAKIGVAQKNILFGNGSDELIDIVLKTLRGADAEIVTADVTFVEYRIVGRVNGFRVVEVPLRDFTYDLEAMARAVTPRTRAVFIANPNNPTGTMVTRQEVLSFLDKIDKDVLVVFDEAYAEYAAGKDYPETLGLLKRGNVAVLRTFSKAYGLAGCRIGYLAADEGVIAAAERVRPPFNVNSLAQAAAFGALNDTAFVNRGRSLVRRERERLYRALGALGVWYAESAANFIFVRFGLPAKGIGDALLKKGVIIRDMSMYGLDLYARITVGTPQENTKLIKSLKLVLEKTG